MADRLPGIRPRPTLWRMLDAAARSAFPVTTTAIGLILLSAPLGLPGQAQLQIALALSSVFFWSVFRPSSMAPLSVFALGLLADLLALSPFGAAALILLAVHGIALRMRRFLAMQQFLVVWLVFLAVAAGAVALYWLLSSALTLRLLPPGPCLLCFGLAAGFYPLLAVLMIQAHRGLADPERA